MITASDIRQEAGRFRAMLRELPGRTEAEAAEMALDVAMDRAVRATEDRDTSDCRESCVWCDAIASR